MADLGPIPIAATPTGRARRVTTYWPFEDGIVTRQPLETCTMPIPPAWFGERPPVGTGPQPTRSLSGYVMQRDEDGNDHPLPRCVVSLFHRQTRIHVARTRTDASGFFRFEFLMPGDGAYFAVAFDPEGLPVQNSLILDRLTPE